MASKRKKSRPTKIERDENLHVFEEDDQTESCEDTLARIQRYIEEESEDTPDACSERINSSLVKRKHGQNEPILPIPSNGVTSQEGSFPNIFANGHVPSNLKFHQLKKDEVESIESTTAYAVFPEVTQAFVNGHSNDERITFKPVEVTIPAPKKSPSKRSKLADDESPRYTCSTCKYVTNRSDHYKRHLMTHSSDKPLKCSMCSYSTGRSDHYKRHLQRHGLSEKDIIETCSRNGLKLKSTSLSALSDASNGTTNSENVSQKQSNSHVKPVGGPVRKRYKCETCGYATDKMSHFTRHKSCHTKTGVVHCDKCNKSFKSKSYFSQHKCRQLSDRHCPICKTIFIDKNAVKLHISREHQPRIDEFILTELGNAESDEGESNGFAVDLTSEVLQSKGVEILENRSVTTVTEVSEKEEPIDLTTADHSSKKTNGQPAEETEVVVLYGASTNSSGSESLGKEEETSESTAFVPKIPSPRGNLGCTKCGVWFNKLNEYSSHACVS